MRVSSDRQASFIQHEAPARKYANGSVRAWLKRAMRMVIYFAMFPLFLLGASFFYLAMRCHLRAVQPGKHSLIARLYIHYGARFLFWILHTIGLVSVKIELRALSEGASVVVANHPSMLDAMLLLSAIPNAVCVMKPSLSRLPILGGFARHARYVSQAEVPELLEAAKQALASGASIIVFPEGTRSPHGGIGDFKRGAARLALEAGCPIISVAILMNPVVLGRDWPFESPPVTRIRYEGIQVPVVGLDYIARIDEARDDLRSESVRLTRYLEDQIRNWLLLGG